MVLNVSYVCLHAFSLRRESPDPDPERRTPHFWGGSVTKNPGELFWWKDKGRRQTNGTSMLQKAMELKQKKKLEPLKCNSFVALHADSLAKDMNLKFGIIPLMLIILLITWLLKKRGTLISL
jgi:hypothetical protein